MSTNFSNWPHIDAFETRLNEKTKWCFIKNNVAISHYLHDQKDDKLIRQFMMEESKLNDWFMDRHSKKHAFNVEIVDCRILQPKFHDSWN